MRLAWCTVAVLIAFACSSETPVPEATAIPPEIATPAPDPGTPGPTPDPSSTPEPLATLPPTEAPFTSLEEGPSASVVMQDLFFDPGRFRMVAQQGLELTNAGGLTHNFSVADSQVDFDVEPGEVTNTEAISSVLPIGTHPFFCRFHQDEGMVGTFRIEGA